MTWLFSRALRFLLLALVAVLSVFTLLLDVSGRARARLSAGKRHVRRSWKRGRRRARDIRAILSGKSPPRK